MKKFLVLILTLTLLTSMLPVSASDGAETMALSGLTITTNPVENGMRVTMAHNPAVGVSIYYTLDGSEPDQGSNLYNGRFVISEEGKHTVKAAAYRDGKKIATESVTAEVVGNDFVGPTAENGLPPVISVKFENGRYQVEFINLDKYIVYYITGRASGQPGPNNSLSRKLTYGEPGPNDPPLYINKPTLINMLVCKVDGAGRRAYAPVLYQVMASRPDWNAGNVVANLKAEVQAYYGGRRVTLSTDTEGADIYYRISEGVFTDDVTVNDTKYSGAITIDTEGSFYIRAFGAKEGMFDSDQTGIIPVTVNKCAKPRVTVEKNEQNPSLVNVIAEVDDDSEIYYTTDGSAPNQSSIRYTGPRVFNGSYDLKFIAMKEGSVSSDIVTESVKTQMSPLKVSAGTAADGTKTVTISSENEDSEIYYRVTDRSKENYNPSGRRYEPTLNDELYTEPIVFDQTGSYYLWAREYLNGTYGPLYYASVQPYIVDLDIRMSTLQNGIKTASITAVGGGDIYYAVTTEEIDFDDVPIEAENLYTYPVTITSTAYVTAVEVADGDIIDQMRVYAEVPGGPIVPEEVGGITFSAENDGEITRVSLGCADDMADIFYVFDKREGTVATTANSRYGGRLNLEGSGYLHVLAARPGYAARSETYRIGAKTAPPRIDAQYNEGLGVYIVRLSCETAGAKFYYTTDGTMPSTFGSADVANTTAPEGVTFNVVAVADGCAASDLVTEILSRTEPEQCTLTSESGGVIGGMKILLTANSGASVYYTLDGSEPGIGGLLYDSVSGITVTAEGTTLVRAVAVKNGWKNSEEYSEEITLSKLRTPQVQAGAMGSGLSLINMSSADGASIYYTTDGSLPAPGAPGTNKYDGNFYIYEDSVITAVAAREGYANSSLYRARLTVVSNIVAVPISDDLEAEDVMGGRLLTIISRTEGASIYYSLRSGSSDEITPNILYTGPVLLNKPQNVVTVFARKEGMDDSIKVQFRMNLPQAPMPEADIENNSSVEAGTEVELSVAPPADDKLKDKDFAIFYTTDGTAPTTASSRYAGPIAITGDTRIRAIAAAEGVAASDVLELYYTLDNGEAQALTVDASGLEQNSNFVHGSVTVRMEGIDVTGKKVVAALYCNDRLLQTVSAVPEEDLGEIELAGFSTTIDDVTQSAVIVKAFVFENDGSLAPLCRSATVIMR